MIFIGMQKISIQEKTLKRSSSNYNPHCQQVVKMASSCLHLQVGDAATNKLPLWRICNHSCYTSQYNEPLSQFFFSWCHNGNNTWADLSIVMTSKRLIHRLIHRHFSIVRPKLKPKLSHWSQLLRVKDEVGARFTNL